MEAPSNLPPLGEASDVLDKDSFEGDVASPNGGRVREGLLVYLKRIEGLKRVFGLRLTMVVASVLV